MEKNCKVVSGAVIWTQTANRKGSKKRKRVYKCDISDVIKQIYQYRIVAVKGLGINRNLGPNLEEILG
jgi:hypothetical protein